MNPSKINILVACEESQTVCKAFRERGFTAFSCDIQEPSGGHPEWHILGDAIESMRGGQITTMDGHKHTVPKWDLVIAHPPCTYLTNCGTRWFSLRVTPAEKVVERWRERCKAAVFFMHCIYANAYHIAVENPVGFMSEALRKPEQTIDPYMFADSVNDSENYVTKRTCLWLEHLPVLQTNNLPKPNNHELFGTLPNGKARTWEDTYTRKAGVRSKTFPGIAEAMASQWGDYLLQERNEKK